MALFNKKQKFPRISEINDMKKFSFTKCGSSRYFYQVLWQFLSSRRSRSNFGGWPSPPQAAKNVRTIFRIEHQRGIVKFASPASAGSATKL